MALDNTFHVHASFLLQIVDVLRHHFPKQLLVLKHLQEVVSRGGIVSCDIKMLRKSVKGLWLIYKVAQIKQSFGARQIEIS